MLSPVDEVDAVDDYTVKRDDQGSISRRCSRISRTASSWARPRRCRSRATTSSRTPLAPARSSFVSWSPGEKLVVEAAGGHFGGDPKIKTHRLATGDRRRRRAWSQLRTGAGRPDHQRLTRPDLAARRAARHLRRQVPEPELHGAHHELRPPPFDDPRVRQAMNYADRQTGHHHDAAGRQRHGPACSGGPAHEGYDPNLGVDVQLRPGQGQAAAGGRWPSPTASASPWIRPTAATSRTKPSPQADRRHARQSRRAGEGEPLGVGRLREAPAGQDQRHAAHPAGRLDHGQSASRELQLQDQGPDRGRATPTRRPTR